jgi:hypothetical protein
MNLPKPKPTPESPKNWIVCAAIRNKEGRTICGARHYCNFMREQIEVSGGYDPWYEDEQGFIDQYGNFYTREEAWIVAEENGQIRRRIEGNDGTLFSENLY